MVGGNEQTVAVKFCFKSGLSATETLVLVQKAYGNEALNRSNVLGGILDFEILSMHLKTRKHVNSTSGALLGSISISYRSTNLHCTYLP